jgi:hypothetical protein
MRIPCFGITNKGFTVTFGDLEEASLWLLADALSLLTLVLPLARCSISLAPDMC